MVEPEHRYDAFISYRTSVDADRAFATRFQRALERYRVPRSLRKEGHAAALRPVFRDTEELAAVSDLSAAIQEALKASRFLIVVCSPETPASTWIDREIDEEPPHLREIPRRRKTPWVSVVRLMHGVDVRITVGSLTAAAGPPPHGRHV